MMECLEAMRAAITSEMALGLRLNCDEGVMGGLLASDCAAVAETLDGSGIVDFIDLDVGTYRNSEKMIAPALEAPVHWQVQRIRQVRTGSEARW